MLHLDVQRLAALADSDPTTEESAHLVQCARCAREREAQRALLALVLSERATVAPRPLTDWSALESQLRDEGLVRSHSMGRVWSSRWLRVAAAVMLTLGGAAAGRWSATRPAAPAGDALARGNGGVTAETGGPVLTTAAASPSFSSAAEALATLRRAESEYRVAAAYLAAQDTASDARRNPDRYRTRLAALDKMSDAALAAVNEAPHDPVINQYYLSTVSARQVTLRQLGNALPSGVRLTGW